MERTEELVRIVLKSQYKASLEMLRAAIERCPDEVWYDDRPRNAYWRIAYHTLYYAHLYLQPSFYAFRPWTRHRADAHRFDGVPGPYSRAEVLEYWSMCNDAVGPAVDSLDLESGESGFDSYPISKLEHQIVNIRHIQHHAAQLADRLRAAADVGLAWVGDGGLP